MQYVMLICGDEANWAETDEATLEAVMKEIDAWDQKWASKVVNGGAELDSSRTARTVSRGRDGQPVVTDGPYLELKEVIGGFCTIEADNMEEAVAIASEWPTIVSHGDKIEVRPVMRR